MGHLLLPQVNGQLSYDYKQDVDDEDSIRHAKEVDGGTSAALESLSSPNNCGISDSNFLAIKKTLYNIKKGNYFGKLTGSSKNHSSQCSSPMYRGNQASDDMDIAKIRSSDSKTLQLKLIQLHAFIWVLPVKRTQMVAKFIISTYRFLWSHPQGIQSLGFSACVMEHPLRIRVFCAQVIAGIWQKNGDAALVLASGTALFTGRTEQGLELDLLLLQCCAALAPPDLYVKRIVRLTQLKFAEVDSQCMNKLQQLAPEVNNLNFLSSITSTADDDSKSEAEISDFDTKHKKSRLLSYVDRGPPSWDQCSDKEQVVESNNNGQGQDREVNVILEILKSRFPSVRSVQTPFTSTDVRDSTKYNLGKVKEDMYITIQNRRDAESEILGIYIVALSSETIKNTLGTENTGVDRELTESTSRPFVYDEFGPLDCDGIYLSSCGHAVHQGCLDRYLSSLKERDRIQRLVQPYTTDLSQSNYELSSEDALRNLEFMIWMDLHGGVFFEGAHIVDPNQGESLCPVCRRLPNSVLPGVNGTFQKAGRQPMTSTVHQVPSFGSPFAANKETTSLLLQQGLCLLKAAAKVVGRPHFLEALSLQIKESLSRNLEPISRVLSKMYFPKELDRFLGSPRLSLPIILWDTLKYSLMSTEIAASSGKTSVEANYTHNLHILKRNDKETLYPDIQLWNWASNPVLARDPFSSLMWVLFCLPCQLFSCEESLVSLVHLFYVVSVIQVFHYLPSCRCALLWKLLNSSAPAPFYDRDNVSESSHVMTDMMDTTENASVELNEIQKPEMFKISPIDFVLEDEVLQSFALKWFHHFKKIYETCSFQNVFYCIPAVPFKLMNLPHVYQDLLQRESGCMTHAMNCDAENMLQRCARQAPWTSPYLDAFGKEDIEMRSGKPLYLNEERYASLSYMVASHGLDRRLKVLGQTTIGTFFMV
ncbi:hypothetical protein F3Y22_tig00110303pilonHSYRG00069 [Hibiscus syriacus]|uniref:E3 ubiquitin-protein ligase n=1 Tax=Hibiscus syriacus TaxID=106335 RepID=A0A6A3B325_HIBSY|nr:hypothetical protein F3Y22_tig00110303pilonHSYRG00069 [Hibiscus syriacus]